MTMNGKFTWLYKYKCRVGGSGLHRVPVKFVKVLKNKSKG